MTDKIDVAIYDFRHFSEKGGINKFNKNVISAISDMNKTTRFRHFYKSWMLKYKLITNLFRLVNYFSGYRLVAFCFKLWLDRVKPKYCIVNFGSLLRYCSGNETKFIFVQHQNLDTLLKNKSNLKQVSNLSSFFQKIHTVVNLSEGDKKQFMSLANECNIVVIPHMTDFQILKKKKKPDKKTLLMIARLDNRQKRFDLAIDVMRFIPDKKLKIYGDGSDKELIQDYINQSDVNNVSLYDYPKDLISVLDSGDMHLMVSDYEGFGIVNLEASARGLPCIIRNTFPASESLSFSRALVNSDDPAVIAEAINEVYQQYEVYSDFSICTAQRTGKDEFIKKWKSIIV